MDGTLTMHSYTTDSDEDKLVHLALAALAVGFAFLLHKIIQSFSMLQIMWWIDLPSVMGFYGLFYKLFDRYLWRIPLLRKLGIIKIPNLNGAWKGYVASSYDEHNSRHDAVIDIHQTWRKISIQFITDNSVSHSLIASILVEKPSGVVLSYEYLNEPKSNTIHTMHMHRGTCWLILKDNGKTLEGEYYTGRDRRTHGLMYFKQEHNNISDRNLQKN